MPLRPSAFALKSEAQCGALLLILASQALAIYFTRCEHCVSSTYLGMPTYKVKKPPQKKHAKRTLRGVYSSLDPKRHEFRLLVLKPGSHDKLLSGTLKKVRFPDNSSRRNASAPFETVSYVWGDKRIRDTILINNTPLDIPVSAVSALKCMRLRHEERSLWIDSICINQEDLQERAQQVSMMAEIYSFAYAYLIHLGDDDDKNQKA
jgi:hypothetical protein